MTKLQFNPARMYWNDEREAMIFEAKDSGRRVICAVSQEALEDTFQAADTERGRRDAFLSNLGVIRRLAQAKYERGLVGSDGWVIVRKKDLIPAR
jgi:hypothetical protein